MTIESTEDRAELDERNALGEQLHEIVRRFAALNQEYILGNCRAEGFKYTLKIDMTNSAAHPLYRQQVAQTIRSRVEELLATESTIRRTLTEGQATDMPRYRKDVRATAWTLSSDGKDIEARLYGDHVIPSIINFDSCPLLPDHRHVLAEEIEAAVKVGAEELLLEEDKRLLALLAAAGVSGGNAVFTAAEGVTCLEAMQAVLLGTVAEEDIITLRNKPDWGRFAVCAKQAGYWTASLVAKPFELRDGWCVVLRQYMSLVITAPQLVVVGRLDGVTPYKGEKEHTTTGTCTTKVTIPAGGIK